LFQKEQAAGMFLEAWGCLQAVWKLLDLTQEILEEEVLYWVSFIQYTCPLHQGPGFSKVARTIPISIPISLIPMASHRSPIGDTIKKLLLLPASSFLLWIYSPTMVCE
jgi:hypothetical protein